jgi:spermidine synthase
MPRNRRASNPSAKNLKPASPAAGAWSPLWIGIGAGAAVGAILETASVAFGASLGAAAGVAILLALFGTLGVWRTRRRHRRGRAESAAAALGNRLAALGSLTLVLPVLDRPLGAAVTWAGGGLGAGPLALLAARCIVGLPLLAPAGLLLGSLARICVEELPAGATGSAPLARLGLGAVAGLALAPIVTLLSGTQSVFALSASVFCLLAGLALHLAERRGRIGEPVGAPPTGAGASPASRAIAEATGTGLLAFAVAFAWIAFAFLSARIFLFAFGNDLPNAPAVPALFAGGMFLGAAGAFTVIGQRPSPTWAGAALLAAAAANLVTLRLFDRLPARFMAATAETGSFPETLRAGLAIAAPIAIPGALFLGAALILLTGRPAERRPERVRWALRVAIGIGAGAVLGVLVSRAPLGKLGIGGTVNAAALVTSIAATAAVILTGSFSWRRLGLAAGGLVVVLVLTERLPDTDRDALLVERDVVAEGAIKTTAQKSWCFFDQDQEPLSVAVLRRGGARRLLVNGRYEVANGSDRKSLGLLAHLPLLTHPAPGRLLLIGSGSGFALNAALAHPLERVDCLATCRTEVRATARFGREAELGLRDPRVHVHLGNLPDLVARSRGHDVIASQPAGTWAERVADLTTREFLELAAARLNDDGIFCQWVPGDCLTKEGFKILLATFASVFPQVEIWAGEGDDVILLARKKPRRHDVERILAGYRRPETAVALRAAWLEDPIVLFSQFLLGDDGVRRLAAGAPIHSRRLDSLGAAEADRRRRSSTVDPVPGLAEIRQDVLEFLENVPTEGFAEAVRRGIQARDLERQGIDRELAGEDFEAVDQYKRALELSPRDGSLRRALARLRSRLGIDYTVGESFAAAYANMREAVETDTTYAEGFANLGMLLLMNESFDYAIAVTQQAGSLEPDNDLVWLQLGRIWKRRGYYDKALPFYERAMAVNPLNVEAAIGYIDTKLKLEEDYPDLEGALAFLQGYLPLEPENGDLSSRIERLERAIERGERTPPPGWGEESAEDSAAVGVELETPGDAGDSAAADAPGAEANSF